MTTSIEPPKKKLLFGFIKTEVGWETLIIVIFGSYTLYGNIIGDRANMAQQTGQVAQIQLQQTSLQQQQSTLQQAQLLNTQAFSNLVSNVNGMKSTLDDTVKLVNEINSWLKGDERVDEEHFSNIDKNLAVLNSDSSRNLPLRNPRGLP